MSTYMSHFSKRTEMPSECVEPLPAQGNPVTHLQDNEFVKALQEGNTEAFRLFFRQRSPEVVALCRRILRNAQDAEDVAADVFLEVWTHRDRFDSARGSLRSYVLMLARSRAIDLYRVKTRERTRATSVADASADRVNAEHPLHERAAMKEFQLFASNALAELSQTEKTAIEMAFYDGLTHAQISNQLDTPLGTIKSNIRRGLAKLRQKLHAWES